MSAIGAPWASGRERLACRAAAQGVAAILVGRNHGTVTLPNGLEEEQPGSRCPDGDTLGRIFILLTGVGAVQRHSFGVPPGEAVLLMPRPDDAVALADVATADELSTGLAEPAHELLKPVWEYAAQLIGQSDVWEAIGKTAAALLDGPLELSEILSVCCGPVVKG